MKKTISLLLTVLLISGCAACGNTAEEPEKTETPVETAEPTATPEVKPTEAEYEQMYTGILKAYSDALSEGADVQAYWDRELNYLVGVVNDAEKVGYCFKDCTGDGIPELLIGAVGEKNIYALYMLKDNEPTLVVDAGERSACYIEPDNAIVNVASSSAFQNAVIVSFVKDCALEQQVALVADYSVNGDNPWYRSYDDDWDVTNDEKIDNEAAEKAIKAYEDNYAALDYTPFSSFEG